MLNTCTFLSKAGYSKDCPSTFVYSYDMKGCDRTCRSLSQKDKTCEVPFTPVDGCGCASGTYLNEKQKCVPKSRCSCYIGNKVVHPRKTILIRGRTW